MRNILDLLETRIMSLPKVWDGGFFPEYMQKLFDNYIELLNELTTDGCLYIGEEWYREQIANSDIKSAIPEVMMICGGLKGVLTEYYNGKPYNAYVRFDEVMKLIKPRLIVLQKSGELTNFYSQDPLNLYRVRVSDSIEVSKADIFHLPLQHRTKAPNCRYSIPGYPCLYLGTSVYNAPQCQDTKLTFLSYAPFV